MSNEIFLFKKTQTAHARFLIFLRVCNCFETNPFISFETDWPILLNFESEFSQNNSITSPDDQPFKMFTTQLLIKFITLLAFTPYIRSVELTFELPDAAEQCFYEDIKQGTKSTIEYQVCHCLI